MKASSLVLIFGCLLISFNVCADNIPFHQEVDEDMEYVREVLEEEWQENPYDHVYSTEDQFENEEHRFQRSGNRKPQDREDGYEQNSKELGNKEQKRARQKIGRDTRAVLRVLKSYERGDYYAVLGLRGRLTMMECIPKWIRRLFPDYGQIQPALMKKAHRNIRKQVHPDKNHDGRAEEAFVAVEAAYSVLSSKDSKEQYDRDWANLSPQELYERQDRMGKILFNSHAILMKSMLMVRKVAGPFSVPIVILAVVFV